MESPIQRPRRISVGSCCSSDAISVGRMTSMDLRAHSGITDCSITITPTSVSSEQRFQQQFDYSNEKIETLTTFWKKRFPFLTSALLGRQRRRTKQPPEDDYHFWVGKAA